jgi:hypothetical protein
VLVSRLAVSNQSGNFTVLGRVNTVTVEPLINYTSQMPDAHGVNDREVTSPQTYLVLSSAVIVGDVPETATVTSAPESPSNIYAVVVPFLSVTVRVVVVPDFEVVAVGTVALVINPLSFVKSDVFVGTTLVT